MVNDVTENNDEKKINKIFTRMFSVQKMKMKMRGNNLLTITKRRQVVKPETIYQQKYFISEAMKLQMFLVSLNFYLKD